MSELNSVRMTNFVKRNSETTRQVSSAISQLSAAFPDALKQFGYVNTNPDSIADLATYASATQQEVSALIAQFRVLQGYVDDYEAMRADPTQTDDILLSNGLDISTMSTDLIRG